MTDPLGDDPGVHSTHKGPRRIGHKGADAISPGNTIESFEAAVEIGVDMVELDVLRPRDRAPDTEAANRSPLVVAHDWHDAASREPLTLDDALDAFTRSPLDEVELDLDFKLPGRESELVDAVRAAGLVGRSMVSTMYLESLEAIRRLEPGLRRGWTYPKVTRPWDRKRWARPLVIVSLAWMRSRLPKVASKRIYQHSLDAMWVYESLITEQVVTAVRAAGAEIVAWTVDDPERIARLGELGVDGIVSNDPRLLQAL